MRGAEPIFLPGAPDQAEIAVAGESALCDRRGALYFPEHGLLCVSDLHLEKGSSYARRGMLVPPYDTVATLLRLQAVIDHYRPKIVVSLGDSFHDGEGSSRLPSQMRLDLSARDNTVDRSARGRTVGGTRSHRARGRMAG